MGLSSLLLAAFLSLVLLAAPASRVDADSCIERIEAPDDTTTIGGNPNIPFSFRNCDSVPVNVLLECSVDGVPALSQPFPNVLPGDTVKVTYVGGCVEPGVREVICTATAAQVENPEMEATVADTAYSYCECPVTVERIDAPDDTSLIGGNPNIPFQFINTSDIPIDAVLDCSVNGVPAVSQPFPNVLPGETVSVTYVGGCVEPGVREIICTISAGPVGALECVALADTAYSYCECPVTVERVAAPDDSVCVGQNHNIPFSFTNTSPVPVNVQLVCTVDGDPGVDTPFNDVGPGETVSVTYVGLCSEIGVKEIICSALATLPNAPECQAAVADTALAVCQPCAACPRTIGFWRQQCDQKQNGSTKICPEGMQALWRCVIEATGVTHWTKNDGQLTSTAALALLSNEALFDSLCVELEGPRPMTLRNMAEIQYLALMLNICSGALPQYIEYDGLVNMTVGEVVAALESAINTGDDLDLWSTVADEINNRIGVLAEDCEDPEGLFTGLPPCGESAIEPIADHAGHLGATAFPNPVREDRTSILFKVPEGTPEVRTEVMVFDLNGRLVRRLMSGVRGPGEHSVPWDLRDEGGNRVAAGLYFYRTEIGDVVDTKKLMILRR